MASKSISSQPPALSPEEVRAALSAKDVPVLNPKEHLLSFDITAAENPNGRAITAAQVMSGTEYKGGNYTLSPELKQGMRVMGQIIRDHGGAELNDALAKDANGDGKVTPDDIGAMALAASMTHTPVTGKVDGKVKDVGITSTFDNSLTREELPKTPEGDAFIAEVAKQIMADNGLGGAISGSVNVQNAQLGELARDTMTRCGTNATRSMGCNK